MNGPRSLRTRAIVSVAVVAVLILAVAAVMSRPPDVRCPSGFVYDQPVGCINPDTLQVFGPPAYVALSVAKYGGQVVLRGVESSTIRFTVTSTADLERIVQALTADGLTVRYVVNVTSS